MTDAVAAAGRPLLRFESLDEMMAEADRLANAERAGRLRRMGNWTLGQALGHIAGWAEYAYTGAPIKTPFFVRWIVSLRRRKYVYGGLRPGVRIPGVAGGTLVTDEMPVEDALARLRRVVARLKSESPTAPSPFFGRMTHEEAVAINLRHAELHLGFFQPE
jgi:hypothetical protein